MSRTTAIVEYFKDTLAEVRKVTWPTREQAIRLTIIVLIVTFVMAIILGTLDFIFSRFFALLVS